MLRLGGFLENMTLVGEMTEVEFLASEDEIEKIFVTEARRELGRVINFHGYGGNYYIIGVKSSQRKTIDWLKKWYPRQKVINYF